MKYSALVAMFALIGVLLPAQPALAACPDPGGGNLPATPALDGEIVFKGGGWGHGTGMSQYGARGAADLGCTYGEILSTYFPNTSSTSRASEGFRLNLNAASTKTSVRALTGDVGWQVCAPNGTSCSYKHVQPRFETWMARVHQDTSKKTAGIRIEKFVDGQWELVAQHGEDQIVRVVMASVGRDELGPVIAVNDGISSRQLARGVLEIDPIENGADTAFVTLLIAMEQYLYGLGEIPSSWPTETLRAQVVAARSYAYQRKDARGSSGEAACRCHMYATTKDQNYVGYGKESESSGGTNWGARWVSAVRDTNNEILTYGGQAIPAFYSSVHGGSSEDYGFWSGGAERPYLAVVDDSAWEAAARAPLSAWALSVTAKELGAALKIGTVTDVQLPAPKGARGRVGRPDAGYGGVVVKGTSGTWTGSGDQLRSALRVLGPDCGTRTSAGEVQRLCSTLFDVDLDLGPPPGNPPTGAVRLTGDWDGDGIDTPGWFKDGTWGLYDRNKAGGTTQLLTYGRRGDVPVVGDWNGDGRDTIGVVRGGDTWILRYEYRSGSDIVMKYGRAGDVPVSGDWNGDGTDTIGVVRDGYRWILRYEYRSGADIVLDYGRPGDKPVTGDFNGDGIDTLGVVRGHTFILRYIYRSGADIVLDYGRDTDFPLTGDWNGDGTDTLGVVRGKRWILRYVYRSGADYVFDY